MNRILIPILAIAMIAPVPAIARDRDRYNDREPDAAAEYAARENCVLPQSMSPGFNNTAVAMEQSRIAAVTVRNAYKRRGGTLNRVCGSEHDPRSLEMEKTAGAPHDPYEDGAYDGRDTDWQDDEADAARG